MSAFRTIGVMGGMGPAATVDFMGKLLAASGATRDQDHPRILVDCDPTIPERHAAIRGEGPSPAAHLARMAAGLERSGAEVLCMPCNTAHAFEPDIRAATALPFISIIEATVNSTLEAVPGARRVGLLAAQGCLDAGLYERAFSERDIAVLKPGTEGQADFMALLWRVKAGDTNSEVTEGMTRLAANLVAGGAEAIVAGCTEVPLVLTADDLAVPLIDSAAGLARATIAAARVAH